MFNQTEDEYFDIINGYKKSLGLKKYNPNWFKEYRETKNPVIKEKIILCNFGLVVKIVNRYKGLAPAEDLMQEGLIGVMEALDRYQESKGSFSTYAKYYISRNVLNYLYTSKKIIILPPRVEMIITRFRKSEEQLMQELKRMPTIEEVIKKIGKLTGKTKLALKPALTFLNYSLLSFDQKIKDTEDRLNLGDTLKDESMETMELKTSLILLKGHINKILKSLKKRERDIIKWKFGLDDDVKRTNIEIGKKLGYHKATVQYLFQNSLTKIREHSLIHTLNPDY